MNERTNQPTNEIYSIIYYTWNHLILFKQMSFGSFKNVTNELFTLKSHVWTGFGIK